MNACVKTGFRFIDKADGLLRVGDLFCEGDLLHVKGIPDPEGQPPPTPHYHHAVVSNVVYRPRAGSRYWDTAGGIEIVSWSGVFREHIEHYYPELKWIVSDGLA